ncbi:myb/SANT-like DNA-binding domain-containing protein 3 [Portunus trituberculatus]|uniref:myb/SANT-like DNA-binding domain-containing protein 3 n=1 Tax=Portunus trituberculatus TaxID=210409 RepID=UPI001E1D0612|nr:myb/SANT-like DNA-binding domain-containing protein 3 [Portunus trituberculatus]
MQRSERLQYMGEEERLLLVDLIRENRAVLLSRATDARSIPLKARTWEKVAKSLAASGLGPQRTVKQAKKIWENMRSRAKKFASDEKKNLLKTGGDPPWQSQIL